MLAPAEFNSLRTSLLPARTAKCTGVRPTVVRTVTFLLSDCQCLQTRLHFLSVFYHALQNILRVQVIVFLLSGLNSSG